MPQRNEKGLTLVELLVAIMILGLISVAITAFLSSAIQAQASGNKKSAIYREGLLAVERMTEGVRRSTFILIPNSHNPTRNMLAVSGFNNDDDDYYFNDPLFPRIDEEPSDDMNMDGKCGIAGIDDDGDAQIDELLMWNQDDDEDGVINEDSLDGVDNDGDGNIDEDCGIDINNDGAPGIVGMDDDGDGVMDEDSIWDDDEDGQFGEDILNEVIYTFDNGTNTLTESNPFMGKSTILSTHVTQFQTTYEAPDAAHGPSVRVALTLTSDDGKSITFTEYVYPRNTLQKTGKRVR